MGVLIDDLITQGTTEPYRMFTSRAEYRLILREDNADLRLTPIAHSLGLVSDEQWRVFEAKQSRLRSETERFDSIVVRPADVPAGSKLGGLSRETKARDLIRRPDVSYEDVIALKRVGPGPANNLSDEVKEQVARQLDIQARYSGYIARQNKEIERQHQHFETLLPGDMDYSVVGGLSNEAREKLERIRPESIGQASRISGITPAAVSLLLIHLKRHEYSKSA